MQELTKTYKISIHALREEGDVRDQTDTKLMQISIHALREEGDPQLCLFVKRFFISIHALREEGDIVMGIDIIKNWRNFYPRPPRGGRHYRLVRLAKFDEFLSTPSARRATSFKFFV